MNKIAAIPLTITTGEYWLIESSTAGDCLAKTGARKSKFPVTAIQHASSHQGHPAPFQQMYQPASVIRHARASHGQPT